MASTEKTAERTNLVLRLGRLLAGVHTLGIGQVPPAPTEYQIAAAAFHPDFAVWRGDASRFVVVGGVRFDHELDDINRGLWDLLATLAALARDATSDAHEKQTTLRDCLVRCEKQTIAAIDAVPIGWEARLLAEKTPFSTYLAIYDAVRTAKRRLHYFDRYLDSDFFALYLRDLDRAVEVRLVTTAGTKHYGVTNVAAVSALAAKEFSDYQLVECDPSDLHDRNLRVDDAVFFLGPSASGAGKCPTNFSPADSTANGHEILDRIVLKGKGVT